MTVARSFESDWAAVLIEDLDVARCRDFTDRSGWDLRVCGCGEQELIVLSAGQRELDWIEAE